MYSLSKISGQTEKRIQNSLGIPIRKSTFTKFGATLHLLLKFSQSKNMFKLQLQ